MRRSLLVGGVVLAALVAPSASAKDFGPGDLRVCNAARCVPIVSSEVVPLLGSFYYSGPPPARVGRPGRRTTSCASETATRPGSSPRAGSTAS